MNKTAIFTFGKFDPPCAQDEDLIRALRATKETSKTDADMFVFPSRSVKNNMALALRRHYLNLAFASYGVRVMDTEKAIDPFKAMDFLITGLGYKNVVAVFWSETANKLQDLKKYTADAESFQMVPVSSETIDGERSVGALLSAATTSDIARFHKACPSALIVEHDYFAAVQAMLRSA